MKLYVNELMKEKTIPVADEVEAKENVWDFRTTEASFFRHITKSLSQKTGTLAVAATDEGDLYFAGYSQILDMPEFYDIDITKNLLSLLDDASYFDRILKHLEGDYLVLLGEELDLESLRPYGFVFSKFKTRSNHHRSIGVIGPTRLKYEWVVPFVRYYGHLIGEVADW
jgi:heat-inducible transcriptional repressor